MGDEKILKIFYHRGGAPFKIDNLYSRIGDVGVVNLATRCLLIIYKLFTRSIVLFIQTSHSTLKKKKPMQQGKGLRLLGFWSIIFAEMNMG